MWSLNGNTGVSREFRSTATPDAAQFSVKKKHLERLHFSICLCNFQLNSLKVSWKEVCNKVELCILLLGNWPIKLCLTKHFECKEQRNSLSRVEFLTTLGLKTTFWAAEYHIQDINLLSNAQVVDSKLIYKEERRKINLWTAQFIWKMISRIFLICI